MNAQLHLRKLHHDSVLLAHRERDGLRLQVGNRDLVAGKDCRGVRSLLPELRIVRVLVDSLVAAESNGGSDAGKALALFDHVDFHWRLVRVSFIRASIGRMWRITR